MRSFKTTLLLFLASLGFHAFGQTCDGGMVATPSGETTVYTCPGDGLADLIMFSNNSTAATQYAYVITNPSGIILGLPPGDMQDFEGAGVGTCLVWGLSYTGNLTAMPGDDANTVALASGCFDLSDNYITVFRDSPDGGLVAMPSGATTRYTCPGDGVADVVQFTNNSTVNSKYAYVITDPSGNILGLPPGDMQDFEGAGVGECWVWGLSYTGNITVQVGDNALTTALTDECFDLSDNFITIFRDSPDGGLVAMPSGATTRYTCPGDGVADVVQFTNNSTVNSKYAYVITDPSGNILGLPPGDMQDFEGAGVGECWVWGLSYTGNITVQVGDNALASALSDECFDLSDNFISVIRNDQCVSGFTLVDAISDQDIMPLMDGAVIDIANLPNPKINIRADVNGSEIESVVFAQNGNANFGTRNRAPYALHGALPNGNYHGWLPITGTYTITATPYSSKSGNGTMGTPQSISFSIINTPPTLDITSFTLVNALTDLDLMTLSNGDVIDLTSIGTDKLNIRANYNGSVESVVFGLNGNASFANRNLPPYALGGATVTANYWPMVFATGSYTVDATPFSSKNGGGFAGAMASIQFSVISSARLGQSFLTPGLSLYPNPSQSQVHLRIAEGATGPVRIRLISMQGQTVFQTEAYTLTETWEYSLDVSALTPGIYLVQYIDEQGVKSRRLIKK